MTIYQLFSVNHNALLEIQASARLCCCCCCFCLVQRAYITQGHIAVIPTLVFPVKLKCFVCGGSDCSARCGGIREAAAALAAINPNPRLHHATHINTSASAAGVRKWHHCVTLTASDYCQFLLPFLTTWSAARNWVMSFLTHVHASAVSNTTLNWRLPTFSLVALNAGCPSLDTSGRF